MFVRAATPVVCLALFVGCSGGGEDKWTADREKVVPTTGVVTLDGQPVEGATVNFHSKSKELAAYGRTDASGRFTLTTYEATDGAVPGEHVVTVKKVKTNTVLNPDDPEADPLSTSEEWLVPKKFASQSTSGQTATVTEEGDNDFTFELQSQ